MMTMEIAEWRCIITMGYFAVYDDGRGRGMLIIVVH